MNSNLEQSNAFLRSQPFFICQPSPYLSPLFGSASTIHQNSQDQLNDFRLQDNTEFINGGEQEHNSMDASLSQILFRNQEILPNLSILNQPQIPFKKQIQTPLLFPTSNKSRVFQIIRFLSSNDSLTEADLLSFGKPLYQESKQLQFIFKTLLLKFLKLRKTKQQMVKYCMRKAFKFISDARKLKTPRHKRQKLDKNPQNECIFSMPFRKNSSQKTMNSQYLKQVFSNPQFTNYYLQFLNSIQQIIQQDNNSKIVYLSQTIEKLLHTNNVSQVQKIKRLPWNRTILKRTQDLARTLIQFANNGSSVNVYSSNSNNNGNGNNNSNSNVDVQYQQQQQQNQAYNINNNSITQQSNQQLI